VVHHDHLDGSILGREDRPDRALDVPRLVPRGDDHRDERTSALRGIVDQTGAADGVAINEQHQEQAVPGGNQPRHSSFPSSTAATTVAAVSVPKTLVMVRNMSGMRSNPSSSCRPVSGSPVAVNAGTRLTMLAEGTLATVSEARNTAAPAWNVPPRPSGTPYSRAMNSTATAWNSALPARPMLPPRGSTKLATVREILRSLSAAASMTGSAASEEVVENAMSRDARMARRKGRAPSRATNATTGRSTAAMSTASPAITVRMNTAMVVIRSTPDFATAPATIAQMPSGAS